MVQPYSGCVSTAHDFELPPHEGAPVEAVDAAVGGQVVYLTRNGEPVAAIVPTDVFEALEDAEDIRVARAALAEPGPTIPLEDVFAEYADDLAAYPDNDTK
jgi:prevent-host-death family protein